ncbi:D-amino-acid transaminase [Hyphomicrobium sp. CS1GBMeth3]|uniref:D-amino-acid transaminase n=1 Tax=Hyphomicrobium sp. CS1GBMeth3 TaxID=1892845 RepID=UPI0009300358|nr:D-amino-acid transaminase [Hyphomicrobium sp. CS1GBMeth3]
MTRVVYVNGRYLPYAHAGVHVEDRGFQFADAIYEVCEVLDGRLVDETRHMERLERSLTELRIPMPMARRALGRVLRETIRRNRVRTGLVYLQVTRGVAPRDFPFPKGDISPTLVCLARRVDGAARAERAEAGISVRTMPDIRWGRCDIKTVMLLPAVLAKEAATEEGAQEAWLVDCNGFVTEGASSNAWIMDRSGALITRPTGNAILPGVTRRTLLDLLSREKIPLIERPFTVAEALSAREAFITSASGTVMPVVAIDKKSIGNGHPGELTLRLRSFFHQIAELSDE